MDTTVLNEQLNQKWYYDYYCQSRKYSVGQTFMALNFRAGPKWVQGVIVCMAQISALPATSWEVELATGKDPIFNII